MMPRSLVRGPLRAIATCAARQHTATRAFSTFPALKNEAATTTTPTATNTEGSADAVQKQEQAPGRRGGAPFFKRRGGDRRGPRRFNDGPSAAKFEHKPSVPYDRTQPLTFAEPEDWIVSSVLEPRPLYSNIAAGDATAQKMSPSLLDTHITGVRMHGDMDPQVEQDLIQELSEIEKNKKDFRKKSDTKLDYQEFLCYDGLSSNFQEVLNPKNKISRFNNGGISTVANVKYEPSSDEVSGKAGTNDELVERSWKRLEYLGGDYSRPANALKTMAAQPPQGIMKAGEQGQAVLEHVSGLIGQNQSICYEDKKKMLRAVEKCLNGY